ncbi:sugar ABC transporter permease [Tengunoibacter tsumagoiensis]|uniref:ABC transporter permease n=1 Tax=Tengunoibacter tsumagoiensis TaxID=2014871 RepID=A0A402A0Y5_9CHLR|nr:carbohydrate ABC transporter permease [Tengunoibacter tsumagoiensis]GCE12820.1 ABC transporter permease [Tengunoibacter tsumagoiensis]
MKETTTIAQPGPAGSTRTTRRPRNQKRVKPLKVVGSISAHVVMIITVLLCILPMLIIISTSFKQPNDVFDLKLIPAVFTWSNYQYVLGGAFITWFFNSLKIGALTTVFGVILAAPAAYAVSRWQFFGKQGLLLLFLVTQMFPAVLLIVPLYLLFAQLSLLDNIFGLVVAYATTALPFSVWMLKNFFDAVPKELDEAANVDGLGPFQVFWRIILPLTLPGIAVVAFFNFMTAWNEFMMAFTFLQSDSNLTLAVGIQRFVHNFGADWSYLAAAAVLVTIPVLVIFIWAQRYLVTGLTGGSVKG